MIVNPGENIPFWYRTGDRRTVSYVVARVTDQSGLEQSGSPFSLAVNGSGTWTGIGPVMTMSRRVVYYEVYSDVGLTIINNSYLDVGEWVEPSTTSADITQVFGAQIIVTAVIQQVNINIPQNTIEVTSTPSYPNVSLIQENTSVIVTEENININLDVD